MQLRFEGRYPFYLLREGGEAPAALRVRCSLGRMYVGHRLGAAAQQRGSQCGLCAACSGHGARPSESTRARLINSFPHIKIFPYFLCLTQPEPSGRRGAARGPTLRFGWPRPQRKPATPNATGTAAGGGGVAARSHGRLSHSLTMSVLSLDVPSRAPGALETGRGYTHRSDRELREDDLALSQRKSHVHVASPTVSTIYSLLKKALFES